MTTDQQSLPGPVSRPLEALPAQPLDPDTQGPVPRQHATGFNLDAFAGALAARDVAYVLSRYALDATIRVVGPNHPPAAALIVTGRRAIAHWLHACATAQHDLEVVHLINGGDRISFAQRSQRFDGTAALLTSAAELHDGLIASQHTILA